MTRSIPWCIVLCFDGRYVQIECSSHGWLGLHLGHFTRSVDDVGVVSMSLERMMINSPERIPDIL